MDRAGGAQRLASLYQMVIILLQPEPNPTSEAVSALRAALWRFLPLAVAAALLGIVYVTGWHRELSLAALLRHRAAIDGFIAAHKAAAVLAYIGLYMGVAALSIPAGAWLSITGGFLFGGIVGASAAIVGATLGATALFLIARSAAGEHLARRAGPVVERFAAGFRADAFNYLLFLRLVPAPFWLVNLVPALLGVRLRTFVTATAIGIIPVTFIFAFFGAGLDSVISAHEARDQACRATGAAVCDIQFEAASVLTPTLLAALAGLGLLALIPVIAKRFWRRPSPAATPDP
jgi:uncharacterized membrane protein YdjX (TVP38/TMEM64 family)